MNIINYQEHYYTLFSNFTTHSYLSLLEQCRLYKSIDSENELFPYTPLHQAIKSFLFILQSSKHSMALLDAQIFQHYIPYQYLTKAEILRSIYKKHSVAAKCFHLSKSHLTPHRAKKCYIRTISHLKKHHEYDKITLCNTAFITLYLYIMYHHFKNPIDLPDVFKASTAKDFAEKIYQYLPENVTI